MYEELKIIHYPDPRLKKVSSKIKTFDDKLGALGQRMLQIMREAKGVGLAAPQIGLNIRLFVSNHTGKPEDDRIYVNPMLLDAEGEETAQEGCLSIPGVNLDVARAKTVKIQAHDVTGKPIEFTETGYQPRIWQHEVDHLNGVMLIDKMGLAAKLEFRKILTELEEQYEKDHPAPPPPPVTRKPKGHKSRK